MSIGSRAQSFEDGQAAKQRPSFISDAHLTYLDKLRESGRTNMFGARHYVSNRFPDLSDDEAAVVLCYWMKTFGEASR